MIQKVALDALTTRVDEYETKTLDLQNRKALKTDIIGLYRDMVELKSTVISMLWGKCRFSKRPQF